MIKRICAAALLTAAVQLVLAAGPSKVTPGIDIPGSTVAPDAVPGTGGRSHVGPDRLKVIYSTLNDDQENVYNCCLGSALGNSESGREQQFMAMPFTPTADGHVRRIDLGITWFSGANHVSISMRADAGGVPGDIIRQAGEGDFAVWGSCCAVKAISTGSIAIQGGVRYWIVARPTANMQGAWNDNTVGATGDLAFKQNDGWVAWNGSLGAFAVLGD